MSLCYTSQIDTALARESSPLLVLLAGINSCATTPLNPVATMARMMAG